MLFYKISQSKNLCDGVYKASTVINFSTERLNNSPPVSPLESYSLSSQITAET